MAFLKELKPNDIREIVVLSAERDEIDRPEESTLADILGSGGDAWRQASAKIVQRIDLLSDTARAELIAVMWLGRGDSGDDFQELVSHAMRSSDIGDSRYLSGKGVLHTYLREGAEKAGVAI
jgi:hypothetical protein